MRDREAINAARRERYASDPEYRQRTIERNRANKARMRSGGSVTQNETDYYLRSRYGIDLVEYQHMLEYQEGRCACCGTTSPTPNNRTKRFHVDHDHVTGKVRALLCLNCNTALGKLGDDPARVASLLAYVLSFEDVLSSTSLGG